MKIAEITAGLTHEVKATKALCRSRKSNAELGASQLASCKSQGLRPREGDKSFKIGRKRVKVKNRIIKGKPYGGPLPLYSR